MGLKFILLLFTLISCNSPETKFASGFLEQNPAAPILYIDDDNSVEGFGGGVHLGTDSSSGVLSLNATSNFSEFNESWTPKWNNMIAYWKFENDFSDSSEAGSNHPMTSFGGGVVSSSVSKIESSSVYVDGVDDYISATDHPDFNFGNNDFAVQMWVYPLEYCSNWDNTFQLNKWQTGASPGNNEWMLGGCGNVGNFSMFTFAFESGVTTYFVRDETTYTLNEWHHVLGVREGNFMKLYVNGVLKAELNIGTISINSIGNNLQLGKPTNVDIFTHAHYDDIAIWNDSLSKDEVLQIYNRQRAKMAGVFTSRKIDATKVDNWRQFNTKTPIPFFKSLAANVESVNEYPESLGTLQDGLRAHWDFEETLWDGSTGDVKDSGPDGYHMTSYGGVQNEASFIGKASYVDGAYGHSINLGSDMISANIINDFTYSFWAKPEKLIDIEIESQTGTSGVGGNKAFVIFPLNGSTFGGSDYAGSGVSIGTNGIGIYEHTISHFPPVLFHAVEIRDWVHVVVTYTNKTPSLYLNGKFIKTGLTSIKTEVHGIIHVLGNSAYGKYKGYVDELSVWDRPLTNSEVIELYRRGANRLKYQVRTCTDLTCNGALWQGPDGTSKTYYSEVQNRVGDVVSNDTLSIYFPEFSALLANRYFQYRVIMESDDKNDLCGGDPCLPSINAIEVGP